MGNLNSQTAEVAFKEAKTKELLTALCLNLIASLRFHEENPDDAAKLVLDAKNAEIATLNGQVERGNQEILDAQQIAYDALKAAEDGGKPKIVSVKVDKKEYEVLFGVEKLTKEELAADTEKCAALIAKGSGALKLLED